jgi:hypothetical protein
MSPSSSGSKNKPRRVVSTAVLAACYHAAFLLSLFFDPEDGGNIFLRNIGLYSTGYKALYRKI